MGTGKKLLDGHFTGTYRLIKSGAISLGLPPDKIPWWWTLIMSLEERFESLRQSAAYDPEHIPPPKELWLDDDKLQKWFDSRNKLRERLRNA